MVRCHSAEIPIVRFAFPIPASILLVCSIPSNSPEIKPRFKIPTYSLGSYLLFLLLLFSWFDFVFNVEMSAVNFADSLVQRQPVQSDRTSYWPPLG